MAAVVSFALFASWMTWHIDDDDGGALIWQGLVLIGKGKKNAMCWREERAWLVLNGRLGEEIE